MNGAVRPVSELLVSGLSPFQNIFGSEVLCGTDAAETAANLSRA